MIRRIFIGLSIVFLVLCMGALLLFNWQRTGFKALTVATGSMRPALPVGSLVLMHRVPLQSIKVGDVITYTNLNKPGTTITHRVVKTYKLGGKIPAFVTKGDANPVTDMPIVGGLVQGKAIWHAPKLGGWLSQTKKPYILLPIIYLAALIIIFEEVRKLSEYYKSIQVYRAAGFKRRKQRKTSAGRLALAAKMTGAVVLMAGLITLPAHALLTSNTVSLANNKISVAKTTPPGNCTNNSSSTTVNVSVNSSGSNTNNVNVSNTTNQNAQTGNATSNGGTATSGNATNTSCSSVNVNVHNGH